jgi:hypothetical protein
VTHRVPVREPSGPAGLHLEVATRGAGEGFSSFGEIDGCLLTNDVIEEIASLGVDVVVDLRRAAVGDTSRYWARVVDNDATDGGRAHGSSGRSAGRILGGLAVAQRYLRFHPIGCPSPAEVCGHVCGDHQPVHAPDGCPFVDCLCSVPVAARPLRPEAESLDASGASITVVAGPGAATLTDGTLSVDIGDRNLFGRSCIEPPRISRLGDGGWTPAPADLPARGGTVRVESLLDQAGIHLVNRVRSGVGDPAVHCGGGHRDEKQGRHRRADRHARGLPHGIDGGGTFPPSRVAEEQRVHDDGGPEDCAAHRGPLLVSQEGLDAQEGAHAGTDGPEPG